MQSLDIPAQEMAELVTDGAFKYGPEEQWRVFSYRQRLLFFFMPFSGVGFFLFTYESFRHLVGLLGRGISPAPSPLPTQGNTT
jgi:hypothetical protein